jgi:hypothetical protein
VELMGLQLLDCIALSLSGFGQKTPFFLTEDSRD